jgi:hypothetical protein
VTLTLVISHHAYQSIIFIKSEFPLQDNPEIIEQCSKPKHNLHAQIVKDEKEIPKIDLDKRVPKFTSDIWTLFFDGSKSQEGAVWVAFSLIQ